MGGESFSFSGATFGTAAYGSRAGSRHQEYAPDTQRAVVGSADGPGGSGTGAPPLLTHRGRAATCSSAKLRSEGQHLAIGYVRFWTIRPPQLLAQNLARRSFR